MKTLVSPGVKANIAPPPFLPYDYQEPIIKDMVQTIVEGKSGLVIQPTATGKSVEAAFTARACILLYGMKGLYLYSENEGLAQARKKFQEIFGANHVKCASYFGYGKDKFVHEADMVFASFQSLNSQYGKWYLNFVKGHFGFVIVNEAHHSQADTYKEVIEYFECGKVGMTATEKRMDGKDIRDIFPHTICEIRIEEAIAKKWVANIEYHVLLSGLSTQKLKKIFQDLLEEGKRISIKQLNENIFVEMHNKEVLKEIYKYAFPENGPQRQVLLFCENIIHVEEMLKLLLEDGMAAGAIHSKQFQSKNREVMKGVREGIIQFLVSVNKLNEDIDLPEAEVGALLRSTDSETVFAQQFGRLLRKSKKKEKAIYLDFVANVDRIIAIQNMVQKIEDLTIKAGDGLLQKDLMRVVGDGFDFSFSDEMRDIMQILRVMREGFYPTWQEASKIAIAAGISKCGDYFKGYKTIDYRLPSNPAQTYENFPGWPKFLDKDLPPDEWKTPDELSKILSIPKGFIVSFVSQDPEKAKWVKKFWNVKKMVDFYHPYLVKSIDEAFRAREGWVFFEEILKSHSLSKTTLLRIIDKLRLDYPHEIIGYKAKASFCLEQYHPNLFQKIKEKIEERKVAPNGWESVTSLRKSKVIFAGFEKVLFLANSFRTDHPEWFKTYLAANKTRFAEFFHPELVKKIHEEFGEKSRIKAPSGWLTTYSLARDKTITAKGETIRKYAEQFRSDHPEWFKLYWLQCDFFEHYAPKLINKIRQKFKRVVAPDGWETGSSLRKVCHTKKHRIDSYSVQFRVTNPEWFDCYLTIKGNKYIEHYHPDLVQKIKEHFAKKK